MQSNARTHVLLHRVRMHNASSRQAHHSKRRLKHVHAENKVPKVLAQNIKYLGGKSLELCVFLP